MLTIQIVLIWKHGICKRLHLRLNLFLLFLRLASLGGGPFKEQVHIYYEVVEVQLNEDVSPQNVPVS